MQCISYSLNLFARQNAVVKRKTRVTTRDMVYYRFYIYFVYTVEVLDEYMHC